MKLKMPSLLGVAIVMVCLAPVPSDAGAPLDALSSGYEAKFSAVGHIDTSRLAALLAERPPRVLVVDVREDAEFAVSHIPGAVRAAPDARADQLKARLGNVSGKTIVFYCSVGYRSSKLATAAKDALIAAGATDVVNLKGGIFAWHNQQRPLEENGAATQFVHPYDANWARYLDHSELARMTPPVDAGKVGGAR